MACPSDKPAFDSAPHCLDEHAATCDHTALNLSVDDASVVSAAAVAAATAASAAALRAVAIGAPTGPMPPMGEPCRRVHCRGAERVRAIVLDCSRMSDIDGTACRGLLDLRADFREQGVTFVFAALPGPVRDALQRYQEMVAAAGSSAARAFSRGASALRPGNDGHLHVPSESLETDTLSVAALVQALEEKLLAEDEEALAAAASGTAAPMQGSDAAPNEQSPAQAAAVSTGGATNASATDSTQ